MSRRSINMDFRKAKEKAKELEDIAADLKKLSNQKFRSSLQTLSYGWRGMNADAYLAKGFALQNEMEATAEKLNVIAEVIRQTATRIYDAEMEALERAEERSY